MKSIDYILLFTFLIFTCKSILQNYPNCLPNSTNKVKSREDSDFNRNFIQQTSFLTYESSSRFTNLYVYSSSNSTSSSLYTFSYYFIPQSNQQFLFVIGIFGVVFLVILAIRVKSSYQKQLMLCFGQNSRFVIIPALIITCMFYISFIFFMESTISLIPQSINSARCKRRYIRQLILYGDNASNWGGLIGYKNLLELQSNYLTTISSMNSSHEFASLPIQNRQPAIAAYPSQFYRQFSIGVITNQQANQTVTFNTVIPSLISANLFNQLRNQHNKIRDISKLALQIQINAANTKLGATNTSASLKKKRFQFIMMAKVVEKMSIFSEESQGQFQSYYNNLLLITKIYLGFGLQIIFSYLCLSIISLKVKHKTLTKMTNFVWILILGQFFISIVLLFCVKPITNSLSIQCPYYDKIMANQTFYDQVFFNSTENKLTGQSYAILNFAVNLYQLMKPCIFQTSQTTQFANYAAYQQDSIGLTTFMRNIQQYMNYSDRSNNQFKDLSAYQQVYSSAIQYIQNQIYGVTQNWPWLNDLINQINSYTLYNVQNDGCYKHRWVFDMSGCVGGQDIQLKIGESLLLPNGSYPTAKIVCLPLIRMDELGSKVFLTYKQFISNYMIDLKQTRCLGTIRAVINISLSLTDSLPLKKAYFQPIIDSLQTQKVSYTNFLRIMRSNYLTKKKQYNYLLTQANTKNITSQLYKNYSYAIKQQNNCTCIRQWLTIVHEQMCVDLRAKIMKIYLLLVIQIGTLAGIICLGIAYGINEQMREYQPDYYQKYKKIKKK